MMVGFELGKEKVKDILRPSDSSLTVQSPWLSGRATERGIRRSEVRFLMGSLDFFFVPHTKNIFPYFFTELKTYHLS